MPARLEEWPAWPEFALPEAPLKEEAELLSYKEAVVAKFGEAAIIKSWLSVCRILETLTNEIATKGTSILPEVSYDEFCNLSQAQREQMKNVGCFVIRGVIPEEEAKSNFASLKAFVEDNKDKITGWPYDSPAILDLYWSPTQLALRTHPHQLKVQNILNSWWEDSTELTSAGPLIYADAVRIRPPGVPLYGLGPHIDAGNLCRWADPGYLEVYSSIFSGEPEKHLPYDLTLRKDANQALFQEGVHQSTVFRAFQGWTALTRAGAHEGSLLLYPNVKTTIAYLLLRPFFKSPEKTEDVMDATKWTFDFSQGWFPGSSKSGSQLLSASSHPHLRLQECMTRIPTMNPGDTIWWHCDMVHAVEVEHSGNAESSVAYIAATPTTETNKKYVKRQLQDFLSGLPLEDFQRGLDESKLKWYNGELGIAGGEAGRLAMGYEL